MMMAWYYCAWYYCDDAVALELSSDPEGTLAWLCDQCAEELGDLVSHAGNDLVEQPCWRCRRWDDGGSQ